MKLRFAFTFALAAAVAASAWSTGPSSDVFAQDDTAEEKDSSSVDPVELWNNLKARQTEISEELNGLQKEFAEASDERKVEIRDQFQSLIEEFQTSLMPRMSELAPVVYEKNPEDFEAGELVLQVAYANNQYEKAKELVEKMLQAGRRNKRTLNYAGAIYFALHEFEKAQEVLKEAEEKDLLEPRIGGQFLEPAGRYVELWKEEQEIREQEANAPEGEKLPQVVLKTSKGDVKIELFENQAPNAVANYISIIESGKYEGSPFHRVIPNFMAQGGRVRDEEGNFVEDGLGYNIECECYEEDARKHFRGTLSMAHAGKDTGSSQFFLTHIPTYWLDAEVDPEHVHTVFGRVIEGMDVVDSLTDEDVIESAEVLRKRDHEYKPETIPAS